MKLHLPSRKDGSTLSIGIIISAFNEEKYLGDCLRTLTESCLDNVQQIVVVDNASTDRTAEIAASFPNVRLLREDQKGVSFARQRGYHDVHTDILAFLDADTQVPRKWPRRILREFQKDPELVCLSGPYEYFDLPRYQQRLVTLYWKVLALPTFWITRYMVVGGNFAVRREALERIGGFDTSIAFYGDDTNIARRMATVGRVKFTPRLMMRTSGRRLREEGLWHVAGVYMLNFLSEAIRHRPYTKEYRDIR